MKLLSVIHYHLTDQTHHRWLNMTSQPLILSPWICSSCISSFVTYSARHGSISISLLQFQQQKCLLHYCKICYALLKGRVGGIAIVYKSELKVCKSDIKKYNSNEHIQVLVQSLCSTGLWVSIVYRPLPNKTTVFTFSEFCNVFSDLLDNVSFQKHWLLMCSDFNIHVDDPSNKQSLEFKQIIEPYGLKQHVTSSTHKEGHTLDLSLPETLILCWKVSTYKLHYCQITFGFCVIYA